MSLQNYNGVDMSQYIDTISDSFAHIMEDRFAASTSSAPASISTAKSQHLECVAGGTNCPLPIFEYHSVLCDKFKKFNYQPNCLAIKQGDQDTVMFNDGVDQNNKQNGFWPNNPIEDDNQVRRIFYLLRISYKYVSEEFPSLQKSYYSIDHLTNAFAKKLIPPGSLNISYQIQVLSRKLVRFTSRLRRLLDNSKLNSCSKYVECSQSLNILISFTNELLTFTDIEFRHKDWQFPNEDMKQLANRLEWLLRRVNDTLRETHLYNTIFNWQMDHKAKTVIEEHEPTYAWKYGRSLIGAGGASTHHMPQSGTKPIMSRIDNAAAVALKAHDYFDSFANDGRLDHRSVSEEDLQVAIKIKEDLVKKNTGAAFMGLNLNVHDGDNESSNFNFRGIKPVLNFGHN